MEFVPKEILWAIGWCMIISCIGFWVRYLICFLVDENEDSLFGKVVKLFKRE